MFRQISQIRPSVDNVIHTENASKMYNYLVSQKVSNSLSTALCG